MSNSNCDHQTIENADLFASGIATVFMILIFHSAHLVSRYYVIILDELHSDMFIVANDEVGINSNTCSSKSKK